MFPFKNTRKIHRWKGKQYEGLQDKFTMTNSWIHSVETGADVAQLAENLGERVSRSRPTTLKTALTTE